MKAMFLSFKGQVRLMNIRTIFLVVAVLLALGGQLAPLSAGGVIPGDCNQDADLDISDAICLLGYLFVGNPEVLPCGDGGVTDPANRGLLDINSDDAVDLSDAVQILGFLFSGGAPPTQGTECINIDGCPQVCEPTPVSIVDTSPGSGETGVMLNRESIVYFSGALDPATVTPESIRAEFAGESLPTQGDGAPHVSSDASTVTLFYAEALPAGARVRVTIDGDLIRDATGIALDADGDGSPGGVKILEFDTVPVTTVAGTSVSGRVFASEFLETPEGDPVNMCLEGVTLVVVGVGAVETDAFGNFHLEPAPVGQFFVHINGTTVAEAVLPDGSTAPTQFPDGPYYPNVGKIWESVAGRDTNVGNVYLPLIRSGTLQPVSEVSDTEVTLPEDVLADFPEFENVSVTVPAGSLFNDDGTPGTRVGIAPVPPDRLPGALPEGLEFPVVITVQTGGATNFDTPAPVCFPNLPDPSTGEVLAAGEKSALWSFNHDSGRFEVVGPMTVSEDETLVCTDPGVGIRAPGWHGSQPGTSGNASSGPSPGGGCAPGAGDDSGEGDGEGAVDGESCACPTTLGELRPAQAKCVMSGFETIKCTTVVLACDQACSSVVGQVDPTGQGVVSKFICPMICGELEDCKSIFEESMKCFMFYEDCIAALADDGAGAGLDTFEFLTQVFEETLDDFGRHVQIATQVREVIGDTQLEDLNADQLTALESFAMELETRYEGATAADYYAQQSRIIDRLIDEIGDFPGLYTNKRVHYVLEDLDNSGVQRGLASRGGALSNLILRARTRYRLLRLLEEDFTIDEIEFVSASSGRPTAIPRGSLALNRHFDEDEDALSDAAEFVLGTDPLDPDSDGDGILDGAEVEQGLDPLDGLAVTTGVIATADTPGTAIDVSAQNDVVVVADSDRGVSVFNVFNGMDPVIVAQVDTPGAATAVAFSGSQSLIAVADALEGLAIIDIKDPRFASIVHQIPVVDIGGGSARAVATAGELAFVGMSSGTLAVVHLPTGAVIDTLATGEQVEDVAIEGKTIYVLTLNTLLTVPLDEVGSSLFEVLGSVSAPRGAGTILRRRLFVGDGFAYSAHASGYNVHDMTDPENPALCSAGDTAQRAWKQIVSNGSGTGIAAAGLNSGGNPEANFNPATDNVFVYDLSEPCTTDVFVTQFDTPGVPRAVSIYNGLAFAADNSRGLQVVNYLPYDALGQAPSVAFTIESISGAVTESEVEEGSRLLIDVLVTDDVQVRNVELLQSGQVVQTDGNFPFQLFYTAPLLGEATGDQIQLAVRASDTGGNSTTPEARSLTVQPDNFPPTISSAPEGDVLDAVIDRGGFTTSFSEPIDPDSLSAESVKIIWAGPDGMFGTVDDEELLVSVSLSLENRLLVVVPVEPIPQGHVRLVLDGLTDVAGNLLDGDGDGEPGGARTLAFTVLDAQVLWIGPDSGSWTDAANWEPAVVPGVSAPGQSVTIATDDVVVTIPAGTTVQIDSLILGDSQSDGGPTLVVGQSQLFCHILSVSPGATLRIASGRGNAQAQGAELTASSAIANEGLIELTSVNSGCCNAQSATLRLTEGTLLNAAGATIRSLQGEISGERFLDAALENHGTLDVQYSLTLEPNSYLNAGSITIAASQTLALEGGALIDDGGALSGEGTLSLASSRWELRQDLSISSPLAVDLRSMSVEGTGILTNRSLITLEGTNEIAVPLSNEGLVLVSRSVDNTLSGSFTNTATGTLRIASGRDNGQANAAELTATSAIVNEGLIELTSVNLGCCDPQPATLRLTEGTLLNAEGATIRSLQGGFGGERFLDAVLENHGTLDVQYSLTLEPNSYLNAGSITIAASQTLALEGGALIDDGGALSGEGTLSLASSRWELRQDLSISSPLAVDLRSMSVEGTGILTNRSLITLEGTNEIAVPLSNEGLVLVSRSVDNTLSGSFTNTATGTLRIASGRDNGQANAAELTATSAIVNEGLIELTSVNQGCCNAQPATLRLTEGTLLNAAGATIRSLQGGYAGERFLDAALENHGTLDVQWPLRIERPAATHTNAATGSIVVSGGDLTVEQSGTTPTFTNAGNIQIDAGRTVTINGGTCTNTGTITGPGTWAAPCAR